MVEARQRREEGARGEVEERVREAEGKRRGRGGERRRGEGGWVSERAYLPASYLIHIPSSGERRSRRRRVHVVLRP